MKRVLCLLSSLVVGCTLGCSSLGFATYPVAHFMTDQTKEVLEASPRRPVVARELAKEVLAGHFLQPGDELLVEAMNGESEIRLPADQQVAADGSLDLGKFGRIIVTSMTLEQAERLIQQTLSAAGQKDVAVNIRLIQPVLHYYVVGEVNSPGSYPLTGFETVLDGIMAAGGLTSRASACDTLLARPTSPCSCRVTLPVCYRAITQLGDTTTNYQLKPGDRIFVGRQTFLEELLPCCATKTCQRCCDSQQACCNPNIAEFANSDFIVPTNVTISPPAAIASEAEASKSGAQTPEKINANHGSDDLFAWPPVQSTNTPSAPNNQSIDPSDSRPTDSQDGQLEFEPFDDSQPTASDPTFPHESM